VIESRQASPLPPCLQLQSDNLTGQQFSSVRWSGPNSDARGVSYPSSPVDKTVNNLCGEPRHMKLPRRNGNGTPAPEKPACSACPLFKLLATGLRICLQVLAREPRWRTLHQPCPMRAGVSGRLLAPKPSCYGRSTLSVNACSGRPADTAAVWTLQKDWTPLGPLSRRSLVHARIAAAASRAASRPCLSRHAVYRWPSTAIHRAQRRLGWSGRHSVVPLPLAPMVPAASR
jgi:hypothetical protein